MNAEDLRTLADTVRNADHGSRDLDCQIGEVLNLQISAAADDWPGEAAFTRSFEAARLLLPSGFWWRGGTCHVSSEVRVCPDHNDPMHRERLLLECPPTLAHWDQGLEIEIRPGGDDAFVRAFVSACLLAKAKLLERPGLALVQAATS